MTSTAPSSTDLSDLKQVVRLPLTRCQRDVYVAASQLPGHPQFTEILHERFDGELDLAVLTGCLRRALSRNDNPWQMRFAREHGEPYQWLETAPPEISVIDLRLEPDPAEACAAWIAAAMRSAFVIDENQLAEVAVLRETDRVTHLCVRAHHLVGDGWTAHLLRTQVLLDYDHVIRVGRPMDPPGSSYQAAIEAESIYVESDDYVQARDLLRSEVEDFTPALFTRRERSGARTGARHSFTIDGQQIERILANGLKPAAYLSAVLALYLSRCHRSDDIAIGIPFANRVTDEERMIWGHFANMLPLRVKVPGTMTVRELVAQTTDSLSRLKANQRFPLGDLLRDLGGGTSAPRQLFDVLFSYLRLPPSVSVSGVASEYEMLLNVHDQDALSIVAYSHEGDSALNVDLHYACDVFDDDLPIDTFAAAFQALVAQGIANIDRPISSLTLVDADERDLVIGFGTGERRDYSETATVHELFEAQATRTPDRVAVIAADGTSTTYGELDASSNQIASGLQAEGVGADDRVAVVMQRGPHLLPALLGVLKSGAAYVPVDPGYPAERIRYIIENSGAKIVLVSAADGAVDAGDGARSRVIEDLLVGPTTPVRQVADTHSLAYVIYTSGSTGRPKGVMVEHHSVINRLAWMQRRYPLGDGDVLLQKTPTSFDVSVWELFWWSAVGARLALAAPGAEKDPYAILDTINAWHVTVIHFVPSMFGPFLDLLEEFPELRMSAEPLRRVFCSGEALPPARVQQFNRIFDGNGGAQAPRLVNLYGPTEATVDVSFFDCPADPAEPVSRVPIGRPIDNIRLYVLDAYGAPQPRGLPGELCIAGAGVARGYLGRPELTSERFVEDPLDPGERMYRTGDLARWLADGNLEYLGRFDGQVKIRGNRVELGEVENALAGIDGVREAVVTAESSGTRGAYLVGHYVADAAIAVERLRQELSRSLPAYMIPTYFSRIEHVPLTPNGKADRAALASATAAEAVREYEAPRTDLETTLASVWSEELDVQRVGIHDNYYSLGGDSITALRVRDQALQRGLCFSLSDLATHPTIAELAPRTTSTRETAQRGGKATGTAQHTGPMCLVDAVDRDRMLPEVDDAWPLTYLQSGMIYHSMLHEDAAVYHDIFAYEISAQVNDDLIRAALSMIIARHAALRSRFDLTTFSCPLQIVTPDAAAAVEIADLRHLGGGEQDQVIERWIGEEKNRPSEFERAPLARFKAYVRSPGEMCLVLSFHHALMDGWSVAVLVSEFAHAYAGLLRGRPPRLDKEQVPLSAYVRAERDAVDDPESAEFWADSLAGFPTSRMAAPIDANGSEHLPLPALAERPVPASLDAELRELARGLGVPAKSVYLALHVTALGRMLRQRRGVTGVVTNGRPETTGSDRLVGLFLNTLPFPFELTHDCGISLVTRLFDVERQCVQYRHFPLAEIQRLVVEGQFDTVFNYSDFHIYADEQTRGDVKITSARYFEHTNFAVVVHVHRDHFSDAVRLIGQYDAARLPDYLVEHFLDQYFTAADELLSQAADQPRE